MNQSPEGQAESLEAGGPLIGHKLDTGWQGRLYSPMYLTSSDSETFFLKMQLLNTELPYSISLHVILYFSGNKIVG